jgi:hypothetical protein
MSSSSIGVESEQDSENENCYQRISQIPVNFPRY